jgi:endoglucanase
MISKIVSRRVTTSCLLAVALGCSSAVHPSASQEEATNELAPVERPPADAPITEAPKPPKAKGNPLAGKKLWVDPESQAALRARALMATNPTGARLIEDRIAKYPQAFWLGDWNSDVYRSVHAIVDRAASQSELPVFVVYNVPGRDCGQHSAGGLEDMVAYQRWIRQITAAIGTRGAVVVLEPDALGLLEKDDCLGPQQQAERVAMLHDAVKVLRTNPETVVYLDAGHSMWHSVDEHARLLRMAGVEDAHGFALNTSNYRPMEELLPFGRELSRLLDGAHFIVDTSRNGAGALGVEWCNPPGRKLGPPPTLETGDPSIDGYLWLKRPGESDGTCNGGPQAGAFWDQVAFDLAR